MASGSAVVVWEVGMLLAVMIGGEHVRLTLYVFGGLPCRQRAGQGVKSGVVGGMQGRERAEKVLDGGVSVNES